MLIAPDTVTHQTPARPNRGGNPAWRKGVSGNPNGRPRRGQSTAEIIRRVFEEPYPGKDYTIPEDCTIQEQAVRTLALRAADGDLHAFAWLVERSEGKVPDLVQLYREVTQVPPLMLLGDDRSASIHEAMAVAFRAMLAMLAGGTADVPPVTPYPPAHHPQFPEFRLHEAAPVDSVDSANVQPPDCFPNT